MPNSLERKKAEEVAIFLKRFGTAQKRGWKTRNGEKVYVLVDGGGNTSEYPIEQLKDYLALVRKAGEINMNLKGAAKGVRDVLEYVSNTLSPLS
jgi:hypothetical protein